MRSALALLFAVLLAPVTAVAAPPARTVAEGTNIDWSFEQDASPARYRIGDTTLIFQGRPEAAPSDLIVPVLSVLIRGYEPIVAEGAPTSASVQHRATVGRWDADRPYVLFQSFSGGAHCCNEVQIIYPDNGRLQRVDLGEWDGGYLDTLPTDRNGDGHPDFVFVDNSFLYAFTSYADSWAPPQIMNVVDGRVVNVSTDPSFRPVYAAEMAREREACLHPQDGAVANGACAAYVASAARVGQFDKAWAEMLQAYDRDFEWELPTDCRVALVNDLCPDGQEVQYDNYPDALRQFLVRQGYIGR